MNSGPIATESNSNNQVRNVNPESNNPIWLSNVYLALSSQIVNSHIILWSRFSSYIVFNSVILVAWAQMYSKENDPFPSDMILAALCLLGVMGGIIFAAMGYRGMRYIQKYEEQARKMEADLSVWPTGSENFKLFTVAKDWPKGIAYKIGRPSQVLCWGPVVFAIFFLVLLLVTLNKNLLHI